MFTTTAMRRFVPGIEVRNLGTINVSWSHKRIGTQKRKLKRIFKKAFIESLRAVLLFKLKTLCVLETSFLYNVMLYITKGQIVARYLSVSSVSIYIPTTSEGHYRHHWAAFIAKTIATRNVLGLAGTEKARHTYDNRSCSYRCCSHTYDIFRAI